MRYNQLLGVSIEILQLCPHEVSPLCKRCVDTIKKCRKS